VVTGSSPSWRPAWAPRAAAPRNPPPNPTPAAASGVVAVKPSVRGGARANGAVGVNGVPLSEERSSVSWAWRCGFWWMGRYQAWKASVRLLMEFTSGPVYTCKCDHIRC
jgi:hypothetical protein